MKESREVRINVNNDQKLILMLVIILAATMLTACGNGDPLLGGWQEPTSGVTMDIGNDGKLVMSLNGQSITMTYTLEDPDIITLIGSADGTIPDQKMTYRIEEDKLTLTLDGADTVFYRVK